MEISRITFKLLVYLAARDFSFKIVLKQFLTSNVIYYTNVVNDSRDFFLIFTARNEVCEGYVFTRVCHSVHRGWYPSMPCSGGWYPSMHCRWYPSIPCSRGVSRPTPMGGLQAWIQAHTQEGLQAHTQGRGLQAHTWGRGVSQHALRQTSLRPMDGYCRGWYVSYWNAFLLSINFFSRNG